MTREKYSCYEYEILGGPKKEEDYRYKIYTEGCLPYYDGVIDSGEYYDSEKEARFAAIDHIDLLENGEG